MSITCFGVDECLQRSRRGVLPPWTRHTPGVPLMASVLISRSALGVFKSLQHGRLRTTAYDRHLAATLCRQSPGPTTLVECGLCTQRLDGARCRVLSARLRRGKTQARGPGGRVRRFGLLRGRLRTPAPLLPRLQRRRDVGHKRTRSTKARPAEPIAGIDNDLRGCPLPQFKLRSKRASHDPPVRALRRPWLMSPRHLCRSRDPLNRPGISTSLRTHRGGSRD